jgi:CRP/FNR family transcriptional regulator, cyclic AMP receptor protein
MAKYGEDDTADISVPTISQEALAEMVGTTRPRVNQFMNKFRKLGYTDYDGSKITVRQTLQTVLLGEDQSELDEDSDDVRS